MLAQFAAFTSAEDDRLVAHMSGHEAIYNSDCPEYKMMQHKELIWAGISRAVGRSVFDCKRRWRNIRDTYWKYRRRGDGVTSRASTWALYGRLQFLERCSLEKRPQRPTTAEHEEQDTREAANLLGHVKAEILSMSDGEQGEEGEQEDLEEQQPQQQLPSLQEEDLHQQPSQHPVDTFFQSMAATVKRFPPADQARIKMEICRVVTDTELRLALEGCH